MNSKQDLGTFVIRHLDEDNNILGEELIYPVIPNMYVVPLLNRLRLHLKNSPRKIIDYEYENFYKSGKIEFSKRIRKDVYDIYIQFVEFPQHKYNYDEVKMTEIDVSAFYGLELRNYIKDGDVIEIIHDYITYNKIYPNELNKNIIGTIKIPRGTKVIDILSDEEWDDYKVIFKYDKNSKPININREEARIVEIISESNIIYLY